MCQCEGSGSWPIGEAKWVFAAKGAQILRAGLAQGWRLGVLFGRRSPAGWCLARSYGSAGIEGVERTAVVALDLLGLVSQSSVGKASLTVSCMAMAGSLQVTFAHAPIAPVLLGDRLRRDAGSGLRWRAGDRSKREHDRITPRHSPEKASSERFESPARPRPAPQEPRRTE